MFPINRFTGVKAELISDNRSPKPRLFRYKSTGPLEPYYQFTLTSPPLPLREAMAVDAVLDSYQGNFTNFELQNPIPQQISQSGIYLYQNASKGSNSIVIGGFASNEIDAVVAGDFIQINGSKKAYRILSDANANASGQAIVTLTQGLIQDYISPSVIKYGSEVVFQVCMEDRDSAEITVEKSKFVSHDVELIEQI